MTDDSIPSAAADNFKALNIVHKAFVSGQVIFMVISFFLVRTGFAKNQNGLDKALLIPVVVLAIGGVLVGGNLFRKKLAEIRDLDGSNQAKSELYRGAYIIRWAMLEGPGLFSLISFLLTGNYVFAGIWLVLITLLFVAGPSRSKMAEDLELDEDVEGLKG